VEPWHPLYDEAADGVDALQYVDEAVTWLNGFARRIDSAESATTADDDRR